MYNTKKGYYESVPEANLKLEKEVSKSKKTIGDLRGQVDEVKQALSDAKAQLAERAENQKVVDAAKSTAAELEVSSRWAGATGQIIFFCGGCGPI